MRPGIIIKGVSLSNGRGHWGWEGEMTWPSLRPQTKSEGMCTFRKAVRVPHPKLCDNIDVGLASEGQTPSLSQHVCWSLAFASNDEK